MSTIRKLSAAVFVIALITGMSKTSLANENATVVNRSPYPVAFFLLFTGGGPESEMIVLQPKEKYAITGPDGEQLYIRWNAQFHRGVEDERSARLATFRVPQHHPGKMYGFYHQPDDNVLLHQD